MSLSTTAAPALPSTAVAPAPRAAADLPLWPLATLFIGYPIWWLLGLGDLTWAVFAVPMTYLLIRHRRGSVPKGMGIWLLFLLWSTAAIIRIDSGGRLIGFVYRVLLYLAVTVVFVYVYNALSGSLTVTRLSVYLSWFWVWIIAGGYLGVLDPHGTLHTPLGALVPHSLLSNDLVSALVAPPFAQTTGTFGAVIGARTSAPFIYTNTWGNNYSLLLPFVFVALMSLPHRKMFWFLLVMLPVSLVPAFLTQNRGMLLGLGIGVAYIAVRLFLRGQFKPLLVLGAFLAVLAIAAQLIGVQQIIESRLQSSDTNSTRLTLYQEAFTGTVASPVFGYGAPRPSDTSVYAPSIGTQGQFWTVLYSFGFPGAALYMGFLLWTLWRGRRPPSTALLWLHAVLVMAIVESFYYGALAPGLGVTMIAGAATLHSVRIRSASQSPTIDAGRR